jgi:hypothetical protein
VLQAESGAFAFRKKARSNGELDVKRALAPGPRPASLAEEEVGTFAPRP